MQGINDDYVNENKSEQNENWPYIPDKPYGILIIRSSGSGNEAIVQYSFYIFEFQFLVDCFLVTIYHILL